MIGSQSARGRSALRALRAGRERGRRSGKFRTRSPTGPRGAAAALRLRPGARAACPIPPPAPLASPRPRRAPSRPRRVPRRVGARRAPAARAARVRRAARLAARWRQPEARVPPDAHHGAILDVCSCALYGRH